MKGEDPEARLERGMEDAAAEHRRDAALDPRVRSRRVERLEDVRLVEAVDEALESPDRAAVRPFEAAEVARVHAPLRAERAVEAEAAAISADCIARRTPVEKTGSRKQAASPTRQKPSPEMRGVEYE